MTKETPLRRGFFLYVPDRGDVTLAQRPTRRRKLCSMGAKATVKGLSHIREVQVGLTTSQRKHKPLD